MKGLKSIILTAVIFVAYFADASAYRILAILHHGTKSHFTMGEVLMEGLAKKGHDVVMVSPFPRETTLEHYTDISLSGIVPVITSEVPLDHVGDGSLGLVLGAMFNIGFENCESILSSPKILKLTEEKFDLVIYEMFNTDCFLALIHKFNAPYIAISSSMFMPWHYERFGNPDNPSYVPSHFLPHSDVMTYRQRFMNSVYYSVMNWVKQYYLDGQTNDIVKKHLGDDGPALGDIARNTSLLLLNTHFSLNRPRPYVPAVIEIGGIHLKKPAKLPQAIQKFMDEAKHGVIYFSFGSIVKSSTFPLEKRTALLQAFAELPMRVLWKWEGELPGKPDNVMVNKWLPQHAILNHPKTRLFVTHAGLMGSIEAVAAGVPMVGIPLFGDQPQNLACLMENNVAILLNYHEITKETVLTAIRTVLETPSYQENARRMSQVFNDRPLPPLDTAMYWVEYVIKHHGAPELRAASASLLWYQYFLVDVIAPIVGACLLVTLILYLMVKKLVICVFSGFGFSDSKPRKTNKPKQKKN